MRRSLGKYCLGLLLLGHAATASAELVFKGTNTGAQEVPPNASGGTGLGVVILNAAETQITVNLTASALGTSCIAAHIHGPGAPGVNAPILFDIGCGGGTTSITVGPLVFAITPTQVADLKAGLHYFNVHTTMFAGGEIRGQIGLAPPHRATLSGSQEVPPNASPGSGTGFVVFNQPGNQLFTSMSFSGLGTTTTGGHIHGPAPRGVNAPIMFDLMPPAETAGSVARFFAATPTQKNTIDDGLSYFNVHSTMFPGGEIRGQIVSPGSFNNRTVASFVGDSRTDYAVYHQSSGLWYVQQTGGSPESPVGFGGSGYAPVAADYDGDGKTDHAVFHSSSGLWYIRQSLTGSVFSLGFGGSGYTPVPRDYDNDGKADIAVYHAASGLWYIRQSSDLSTVTVGYGGSGYTPVPQDYDGDGKADLAVFHAATGLWFIRQSSDLSTVTVGYGGSGYTPVQRDYDGDGKADIAVYHAASGLWFIRQSTTLTTVTQGYGGPGYTPVPGDWDGDDKADIAVYHASSGLWFSRYSTTGSTATLAFGGSDFTPISQ